MPSRVQAWRARPQVKLYSIDIDTLHTIDSPVCPGSKSESLACMRVQPWCRRTPSTLAILAHRLDRRKPVRAVATSSSRLTYTNSWDRAAGGGSVDESRSGVPMAVSTAVRACRTCAATPEATCGSAAAQDLVVPCSAPAAQTDCAAASIAEHRLRISLIRRQHPFASLGSSLGAPARC